MAILAKTADYGAANSLIAQVQASAEADSLRDRLYRVKQAADVGDDYRGALLQRLESSAEVLARLDERQRNEFARWVNDIAIVTARAEKEDGKRVSDKEEAALQKIRSIVHG